MSNSTYNESSETDRVHFIKCGACGEWLDCRDLDEIFSHETDHKPHPDIPYSGSKRIEDE